MTRRLIIDGNAVYELDQESMLREESEGKKLSKKDNKSAGEKDKRKDIIYKRNN